MPTPLLVALAEGMVNVPFIASSLAAEMDVAPDPMQQGWSPARLVRFIGTRFDPWGDNVTAGLVDTYVGIANRSGLDGAMTSTSSVF